MTALERLIKLGLTDASPLYRETAAQAQVEYDLVRADLDYLKHYWACNPPYSPCTTTNE